MPTMRQYAAFTAFKIPSLSVNRMPSADFSQIDRKRRSASHTASSARLRSVTSSTVPS